MIPAPRFFALTISVALLSATMMLVSTQATLQTIDQQLAAVTASKVTTKLPVKAPPIYQFIRTLKLGSTGSDVKQLQIYLNSDPSTVVATKGTGSKGKESTYYGPATSKAVSKFQLKYKSDILTANKLTKPTGLFGPATLKKLNALLALSKTSTLTNLTTTSNLLCPNGKTIQSNCTSTSTTTSTTTARIVVSYGGGGGGGGGIIYSSGGGGGGGGSPAPSCTVPTITSSLTVSATVGSAFAYTVTATGDATITYSAGSLPGGLSFSSPTISGTPTTAGSPTVSITATNSCGTNTKTLILTIIAPITGYGATADQGQTDDPLVDNVTYAGDTYYIDCNNGDDTNDGLSPAKAWKTIYQVSTKTYVGYWDTVPANDVEVPPYHDPWTAATSSSAFLFKRGCSWYGHIVDQAWNPSQPGDPNYPNGYNSQNFTFGAYGDRSQPRPIIYYTPDEFEAIVLSNNIPFTMNNLHLISTSTDWVGGISLSGSDNVTLKNIYVEGATADGITADGSDNLTIDNSTFYNNQTGGGRGGGFAGGGVNLRITNSSFINNGRDQIGSHNIYARHMTGALFQGNLLQGGGNLGIVIHGTSTDVTIRGNDFVGNSNGLMVSGYNEGDVFNNFLIEKNLIHDNGYRAGEQGYGMLLQSMTNSIIRNNLVYNNRLGSFGFSDGYSGDEPSSNIEVYNNLFYDPETSGGSGISGSQTTNLSIENNIFESFNSTSYNFALSKDAAFPNNQLHLDHNLYYMPNRGDTNDISWNNVATSTSALAASTGFETHGTTTDPLFVDSSGVTPDFHLQVGSPAIDAGATLSDVTDDFSGTSRPQGSAYDIGPYEHTGGLSVGSVGHPTFTQNILAAVGDAAFGLWSWVVASFKSW